MNITVDHVRDHSQIKRYFENMKMLITTINMIPI